MSGFVGDLSQEQSRILEEFKERCSDVWEDKFDDYFALKWLRARKFSIEKAELMLRNHLRYRKKIDLDNLLDWEPPKVLRDYLPGGICGYSKNGCPIWIILSGQYDGLGVVQSSTVHDISLYTMRMIEQCNQKARENSEKMGKRIETMVFISDMENFEMKQIMSKLVRRVIGRCVFLFESNYPETLDRAFIVNAPSFFPFCWKILRPLLTEETAAKIQIFGKDGWKEALLEAIDADQLPVHYGGTLLGPTGCPRLSESMPIHGKIPKEFYLKNAAFQGSNVQTVGIQKRSSHDIELVADKAGHVINWIFRTDDHNLGFSVHLKVDDGTLETVIPMTKVNCHQAPEEGFHICEKAGTYVFRLDNSFSWFTDKTVIFDISMGPPADGFQKTSADPMSESYLSRRA